jgi:peptidoglycan/xylan/chitin deacetylase (PgdA/CDA1 family)
MSVLLHPAIPKIRRHVYRILAMLDVVFSWRRQLVILAYHGIGHDTWRFGVSFNDFCWQIEQMIAMGYRPVTAGEVFRYIETGVELPKKSFAVTFDDGYRDILLVEHFLAKRGVYPTVFVLAEPEAAERSELGTGRQFLSTREILELHASGWEIGCHSATHADFAKLSAAALGREVAQSKTILEKKLGLSIRYFAYPKGFHDSRVRIAVKAAGYSGAFSMDDGFIDRSTNAFAVPRVGVDRTHTETEFGQVFLPSTIYFRRVVKAVLGFVRVLRLRIDQLKQSPLLDRDQKYKVS